MWGRKLWSSGRERGEDQICSDGVGDGNVRREALKKVVTAMKS